MEKEWLVSTCLRFANTRTMNANKNSQYEAVRVRPSSRRVAPSWMANALPSISRFGSVVLLLPAATTAGLMVHVRLRRTERKVR